MHRLPGAIRCACAIGEAVRILGIEIRAGLHTGEIERADQAIPEQWRLFAVDTPAIQRTARATRLATFVCLDIDEIKSHNLASQPPIEPIAAPRGQTCEELPLNCCARDGEICAPAACPIDARRANGAIEAAPCGLEFSRCARW